MNPCSYRCCAVVIVLFTEKPSLWAAFCCSVEVVNGAGGLRTEGDLLIECMINCALLQSVSRSFADLMLLSTSLSSVGKVFLFFDAKEPVILYCSVGLKARISRSRSTTSFTATDCTLPAESLPRTFFHRRLDSSKPTSLSKTRLACCASTR